MRAETLEKSDSAPLATLSTAIAEASRRGGPPWLQRDVFPFTSRYIDAGGARLHYVDEGNGPTVVMVPGSPMWAFMYRHAIRRLAKTHRCLVVDLPGLGLSRMPLERGRAFANAARALDAFTRHLGLEEMVLVLHATAGPPGLDVAVRRRDIVRGLVISNSFAWPLDERTENQVVRQTGQ